MKTKRFLLEAAILIALALTFFGCGDDGGGGVSGGGGDEPASLGGEHDGKVAEAEPGGGSGLCAGFANGTTREHYGKQKKQFCDERDGKKYFYVTLGNLTWMAENLNYETEGSVCADNDPNNCEKYGRLYDWYEAEAACPAGWHFASEDEWEDLKNFVVEDIGSAASLFKPSLPLMAWDIGTDYYGFSALPGGAYYNGSFYNVDKVAYFWNSTSNPADNTQASQFAMGPLNDYFYYSNTTKQAKESVRCVKNEKEEVEQQRAPVCAGNPQNYDPAYYECREGKNGVYLKGDISYKGETYEAVLIGGQTWIARNLNYAADGSKGGPYGKLYDWVTAMNIDAKYSNQVYPNLSSSSQHQGICPNGWHVPSTEEWHTLRLHVMYPLPEHSAFRLRAAFSGNYADGYADYKDDYGFAALPGAGTIHGQSPDDGWWTSSQSTVQPDIAAEKKEMVVAVPYISGRLHFVKTEFLSLRCLKNY
jgi:uncharacterized protein (TIGR02145 family)